MKDFLIRTDPDDNWNLDLDIKAGWVMQVPSDNQDQRSALASIIAVGTIPGLWNKGVDWASYTLKEKSIVDIDNSVKHNIDTFAESNSVENTIYPIYNINKEGSIDMQLFKAGGISPQ